MKVHVSLAEERFLFPVVTLFQHSRIGYVLTPSLQGNMPVFARRRLQLMLDALGAILSRGKANDLLARLENRNAKDALAAEVELGLLWGISQVAHLDIEPTLPGSSSQPDAFSRDLFSDGPSVIEITALSDDTFSGQSQMERAANIIGQFADRQRSGAASHLHFQFLEEWRMEKGRRRRVRRITEKFRLTATFEHDLKSWLKAVDWPNPQSIRLTDTEVDVVMSWKQYVHPHRRTFSSMPAVADDVEDNPVFKALRRKERQISHTPASTLKCIFLGDAGCRMLRELKPFGPMDVSGEQVIKHFLANSKVDIVCVFSSYRTHRAIFGSGPRGPEWKVSVYSRHPNADPAKFQMLGRLAKALPQPQLEGYQARSWHRQGMFDPQGKGIYLGTKMTSKSVSSSISVSSRIVLELLAGRITLEEFQNFAFGKDRNLFDAQFKNGMTIQAARLEKAGPDEDDDYLVFDLEPDWGASHLRNPKAE